jgi:penicillin-binding protein 1A
MIKFPKLKWNRLEKQDLGLNVHRESHKEGLAPYFREYLRAYMQEWIEKNPKADGSKYDLYTDGLKIYVSIDSRMQEYAEEAVSAHMANLQEAFFKEQKTNKTAPFRSLTTEEIEKTINRAMRVSDRWRKMKDAGITEKEIIASFDKKTEMSVFSWKGEIDTIMTPRDSIFYYKHFLRTGFVAIEPQTGLVKAWVGGVDYRHFMYDAVEKQKRQVGSTFKPFVYITAINQMQLSPCNVYPNSRYTIPAGKYGLPQDWSPDNSDGNYGGTYTLKSALANSVNVISARLIDEVTPTTVAELANRAGVKSEIPHVPSICLGSVELSLYELISAMGSFANKGQHVEPIVVLRIQDKNGVVLEEFVPESSEVVSEESSYVLMEMMKGVTESGTGARLRGNWTSGGSLITGHPYNFTNPIAGKTGTTQNQSDGWFVGIVPNLIAGVWVGGEDRSIHFRNIDKGQGATMALPIWALFMKKCYADPTLKVSKDDFPRPAVLNIEMDCSKVSNTMDVGDPNYPEQGAIEF